MGRNLHHDGVTSWLCCNGFCVHILQSSNHIVQWEILIIPTFVLGNMTKQLSDGK